MIARDGNVFIRGVMNKAVHVPQFFVLPIAKGDVVLKKKNKIERERKRRNEKK